MTVFFCVVKLTAQVSCPPASSGGHPGEQVQRGVGVLPAAFLRHTLPTRTDCEGCGALPSLCRNARGLARPPFLWLDDEVGKGRSKRLQKHRNVTVFCGINEQQEPLARASLYFSLALLASRLSWRYVAFSLSSSLLVTWKKNKHGHWDNSTVRFAQVFIFPADLVVVALQLLMETLVALLHLLLVSDQRGEAVQRTRVQVVSVTPHHSTQRLGLTDHLRPGLTHRHRQESGVTVDGTQLWFDWTGQVISPCWPCWCNQQLPVSQFAESGSAAGRRILCRSSRAVSWSASPFPAAARIKYKKK